MVDFKLVIGTKDGKCVQKDVKDADAMNLVGKKIGDTIKGEAIGLTGYEFLLTGGSDFCGFPMRKDVAGTGRKRILAVKGIGIKAKRKGMRQRKSVCGNTVHAKISQINLKVLKEGKDKLVAAPKEGEEAPKEEKKPEVKPKEEVKQEAPKEEKKPEVKEAPKEEKKAEPSKDEKPKEAPKEDKPKEKA